MQPPSASADLPPAAPDGPGGVSLRRKIDLIFVVLTLLVLGIFLTVEIEGNRSSIREEMEASHRISTQLLSRVGNIYGRQTMPDFAQFLRQTGRVRASEVTLMDDVGTVLYVSPPPTYKAGRFAPDWYTALVAPHIRPTIIYLDGAKLQVAVNPSRAVLDSWDDLKTILISQGLLFIVADVLVFWLVGRWLAPLERIQRGLRRIEAGDHHIRLPDLPGKEIGEMGRAFNRMAQAVEENMQVRQAGAEAQARLAAQRESTQMLNARIEDERAVLARELHDELGQSLTAIRSIAKSLQQHPDVRALGGTIERAAQLLYDTAGSTSDAMHRMIPRLRPMQLDGMGLTDAVRDLVSDLQMRHPQLRFALQFDTALPVLPEVLEISAFRIVQEALTNVVRHAGATQVQLRFAAGQGSLEIVIADDGRAVVTTLLRPGHYGVRGMQERAESLGGTVQFAAAEGGGLAVQVRLPLPGTDADAAAAAGDAAATMAEGLATSATSDTSKTTTAPKVTA